MHSKVLFVCKPWSRKEGVLYACLWRVILGYKYRVALTCISFIFLNASVEHSSGVGGLGEGKEVTLLRGFGWGVVGIFVGGFPWVWGRRGPPPTRPSDLLRGSACGGTRWTGFGRGVVSLSGLGLPWRRGGVGALPLLACCGGAGWLSFLRGGWLL